jgi:iron complex transport system substrate-binding protein
MAFPSQIICLTEESVETLYLLGREDLIAGVSQYVERPPQAKSHPVVSQFIRSDIEQIVAIKPDLVLGFSDLQKDIAKELVGRGLNVFITNQRTLEEILNYILMLGRLVGEESKAKTLVAGYRKKLSQLKLPTQKKLKVYFEEWDHPRLSAITWVSEMIQSLGAENIFADRSGSMARDREVSDLEIIQRNPDVILPCWCGKKVKLETIYNRENYAAISAIKNQNVIELLPEIFLQPGPAIFEDGLELLLKTLTTLKE